MCADVTGSEVDCSVDQCCGELHGCARRKHVCDSYAEAIRLQPCQQQRRCTHCKWTDPRRRPRPPSTCSICIPAPLCANRKMISMYTSPGRSSGRRLCTVHWPREMQGQNQKQKLSGHPCIHATRTPFTRMQPDLWWYTSSVLPPWCRACARNTSCTCISDPQYKVTCAVQLTYASLYIARAPVREA